MEILDILNIILAIIVSAISGYASAKLAYKNEIRSKVYNEREKTYISLFEIIDKLNNNPFFVFNYAEFQIPFGNIKARLKLYASKDVLNIIVPFSSKVDEVSKAYFDLFDSPKAHDVKTHRLDYLGATELELEQEEELYMENHVMDKEYVAEVFLSLIIQIRHELKTK